MNDTPIARYIAKHLPAGDGPAIEFGLVYAGAKPASFLEITSRGNLSGGQFHDSEAPGQNSEVSVRARLAPFERILVQSGWAVRFIHADRDFGIHLGRFAIGPHHAIRSYALIGATDQRSADICARAFLAARTQPSLDNEMRLGAALGYPPLASAVRNRSVARLEHLDNQPPGAGAFWICDFTDTPAGRTEALTYLTKWTQAMAATFPEPFAQLMARLGG